jgi:hypothetical protein
VSQFRVSNSSRSPVSALGLFSLWVMPLGEEAWRGDGAGERRLGSVSMCFYGESVRLSEEGITTGSPPLSVTIKKRLR